jgi:hypothetical protein
MSLPDHDARICEKQWAIGQLMMGGDVAHRMLSIILSAWSGNDIRELLALAKKEKCFVQCADLLSLRLAEDERHLLEAQRRINAECRRITALLPDDAILLKGMALAKDYPQDVQRDSLDVDVCVSGLDRASNVALKMRELGYECSGTALWGRPETPGSSSPSGALRFMRPGEGGKLKTCSLELHLGGFTTSLASTVLYEEWCSMAKPSEIEGVSCLQLEPTGQLCLMLTDYAVRSATPISVRHVVDMVHFMRSSGRRIDAGKVSAFLRRHYLLDGLASFSAKAIQCGLEDALGPYANLVGLDAKHGLSVRTSASSRAIWGSPHASRSAAGRLVNFALLHLRVLLLAAAKVGWMRRCLACCESARLTLALYKAGMRVAVTPVSKRGCSVSRLRIVRHDLFYETPVGVFYMNICGHIDERERWRLFQQYSQVIPATLD